MMSQFTEGFIAGLKDGPRQFFAPLTGAIRGLRAGTQCVIASCNRAHGAKKQTRGHRNRRDR